MRTLSEKELKIAKAMYAKAETYNFLSTAFADVSVAAQKVLKKFESHLTAVYHIHFSEDHSFFFLGVNIQAVLETDFALEKISTHLTVFHLNQEIAIVDKIRIVSVPFDEIGNTLYEEKFPEFIIGSIINYLQFKSTPNALAIR